MCSSAQRFRTGHVLSWCPAAGWVCEQQGGSSQPQAGSRGERWVLGQRGSSMDTLLLMPGGMMAGGEKLLGSGARLSTMKGTEVEGEPCTLHAGLGCAGRVGADEQGRNHGGMGSTCRDKSSRERCTGSKGLGLLWLRRSRWSVGNNTNECGLMQSWCGGTHTTTRSHP